MDPLILRARAQIESGQLEDATRLYRQLLSADPQNVTALLELAETLTALQKNEEALESALKAVAIDPESPTARMVLGIVYIRRREFVEGETALRRAIGLDANLANAYNALGLLLTRVNQVPDGIAMMKKAIELDPKDWKPHYNLYITFLDNFKFVSAFREARTALNLEPSLAIWLRVISYIERKLVVIFIILMLVSLVCFFLLLPSATALVVPIIVLLPSTLISLGYLRSGQKQLARKRLGGLAMLVGVFAAVGLMRLSSSRFGK